LGQLNLRDRTQAAIVANFHLSLEKDSVFQQQEG
jgi:hypothetical protein